MKTNPYITTIIDAARELFAWADLNIQAEDFCKHYGMNCFLREFRTVTIGLPRQVGQTTWLASNCNSESLVIMPAHQAPLFDRLLEDNPSKPIALFVAKGFDGLKDYPFVDRRLKQVFIDEGDEVFRTIDRKELFDWLGTFVSPEIEIIIFP